MSSEQGNYELLGSESFLTFDMLEQIATLVWAHSGDPQMAEHLATAKLMSELWKRFTGHRDIDALRSQTILKISQYVKDHPRATKEELTKVIGKHITEFAQQVDNM